MTVCAFARLGWTPGYEWLARLSEAAQAHAARGGGGVEELDHFHIEWAWRELNDQYAQRMRQQEGQRQGQQQI